MNNIARLRKGLAFELLEGSVSAPIAKLLASCRYPEDTKTTYTTSSRSPLEFDKIVEVLLTEPLQALLDAYHEGGEPLVGLVRTELLTHAILGINATEFASHFYGDSEALKLDLLSADDFRNSKKSDPPAPPPPPAGWYQNQMGSGERWWTGSAWTQDTR